MISTSTNKIILNPHLPSTNILGKYANIKICSSDILEQRLGCDIQTHARDSRALTPTEVSRTMILNH